MSFNKPQVQSFFEIYNKTISDKNINFSALSIVLKSPKVFSSTGKKQVGAITSAERGQHVTVVCCMEATGHFLPPALIYPQKKNKNDCAPLGTIGLVQEKSWITDQITDMLSLV